MSSPLADRGNRKQQVVRGKNAVPRQSYLFRIHSAMVVAYDAAATRRPQRVCRCQLPSICIFDAFRTL